MKTLFMLGLICLSIGCVDNSPLISKIKAEQYVLLKTKDYRDGQIKYAAFKITAPPSESKQFSFEYIFISNGESVMNFGSNEAALGHYTHTLNGYIRFETYELSLSKYEGNWYIGAEPIAYRTEYNTDYCVTEYTTIPNLLAIDFSECEFIAESKINKLRE
ncbi:hypothetical protein RI844_03065 [Thalassotalea fonticola]|uniref:Lipoprotein n=1 Tax=Thalassotalea fonticola TaxID=3065649 RepID=A0ABZ0GS93_9GAMM|nr:hypothetical protein RI844_03065 [Colwelliaceae bacterium S1-1]